MRHHFHRCSHLRVVAADASELSGERKGGSIVFDELCEARRLSRCVGLAECDVLTPAEKRELLVTRVTRMREEGGRTLSPLGDLGGERGDELIELREALLEERQEIVEENRRRVAEAVASSELRPTATPSEAAELGSEGLSVRFDEVQRSARSARLDAIDRGLEEMATGAYGRCARCAGWIEMERLREAPDTVVCGGCARLARPGGG